MNIPDYKLIRSNRRTLSIEITGDGILVARAPYSMQKRDIDRFVLSKAEWIDDHARKAKVRFKEKERFSPVFGSMVLYRGREYEITARPGKKCGFDGKTFFFPANISAEPLRLSMISLYKTLARRYICSRVDFFSERMQLFPTAVRITSANTRWGSCSGKNSISFSWKLIMASESEIDYVVVHELAHIKEHNHSEAFWRIVTDVIPDAKARRASLKDVQQRIESENWD